MPVWEQVGRRGRMFGTAAGLALSAALAALMAMGCASPGPPRAPSLQLPAAVSDLVATRRAGEVELSFAVSARTSDGMAYRGALVRATVCRAVEAGPCVPVAALASVALPVAPSASPAGGNGGNTGPRGKGAQTGGGQPATLHDALPASLTAGPARLLTYRVELANANGHTAGFGDAAYAAAGSAPEPVAGLHAEGSREGVVVRWHPAAVAENGSDVVLRRELIVAASGGSSDKRPKDTRAGPQRTSGGRSAKKDEAGVIWLSTAPVADPLREEPGAKTATQDAPGRVAGAGENAATVNGAVLNAILDDSAEVGSTYRYAAERQRTAQLGGQMGGQLGSQMGGPVEGPTGGHTLVLHSALSVPVEVALRAVYPPSPPTDLVGTVFPLAPVDDPASAGLHGGGLAVDLIWTPAEDASVGAKRVGYNVYREVVGSGEAGVSSRTKLTVQPVRMPAFHDVLEAELVQAGSRIKLQYSVTAVDANGMESASAVIVVDPSGR